MYTYCVAIFAQVRSNRSFTPCSRPVQFNMATSSVDKPNVIVIDDNDVDMMDRSVGKPAENQGSVVKPAQDPGDLVVAWYNITWSVGKVEGKGHAGHERKL